MTQRLRVLALSAILTLAIALGLAIAPPAQAAIRTLEEAPGQVLYQTRHNLRDEADRAWQAIFFKRQYPDRPPAVHLRLVGFPEVAEFRHPAPLSVRVEAETVARAADVFGERSPSPNVGEYDFAAIVATLPAASFVSLDLPLKEPQTLRVPYFVVRQWQAVAQD